MRWRLLAVLAGVAGVGVSVYLTAVHATGMPLACPTNAIVNCEQVLTSSYAVIGGTALPTSAAGIAWFAVSVCLALATMRWHEAGSWSRLLLGWSAVGLLTVLYLVYVEIVRLGAICAWCTVAHVLVLVIFLIALPRPGEARSSL